MNYPKYVKINDKKYKINTSFRVALKCNKIASDDNINDYERALAIIYMLFGNEGLNDTKNHSKLIELAQKYLLCGEQPQKQKEEKIDMDFEEDMPFIEASFMSDYKIDLENTDMHFWKFMYLMNGLSNSEFGNCCVLNNIRNLRNFDTSKIKDQKERDKIIEAQKKVALRKNSKKLTKEQELAIDEFNKLAKLERK